VLGVKKLGSPLFATFLLMACACLIASLRRGPLTLRHAVVAGTVLGLMLLDRPNMITVVPIVLLAAMSAGWSWNRVALSGVAGLVAVALIAAVVVPYKQRFVVFDSYYGAYTFANGAHRYVFEGFLNDYNGELAMPRALEEMGIRGTNLDEIVPGMDKVYLRVGREYALEDPARYVLLTGFKIVNLFRPDFRDLDRGRSIPASAFAVLQLGVTAIFVTWVFVRWRARHHVGVMEGIMAVPMLALYIVPFVLTNSDTRYRVPFDPLFVVDVVWCWALYRERVAAQETSPAPMADGGSAARS
jgi:4-amino-4-deoxy-L-arabinose transferase-like glycosyltransferase